LTGFSWNGLTLFYDGNDFFEWIGSSVCIGISLMDWHCYVWTGISLNNLALLFMDWYFVQWIGIALYRLVLLCMDRYHSVWMVLYHP
jgi:hypothetical protein